MTIIVNADDLGLNSAVNHATFELIHEGLVTSASLLANGWCVEEAARRLTGFPQCSFGAHLNLTEFAPVGCADRLRKLLNADGQFHGQVRRIRNLASLQLGVYEEWCAQMDLLKRAGVPISHIDGHHHVHTIPALFPVLKAVQRCYGIRKVRISLNVYSEDEARGRKLPMFQKAVFNFLIRRIYRTRTTDLFMSLPAYCENHPRFPARCKTGEIMLHPGAPDAANEMQKLRHLAAEDPGFRENLISYHAL